MLRRVLFVVLIGCFMASMAAFAEGRGFAGFYPRNLLPADLDRVGKSVEGIAVDHVNPGTPAEKGGLQLDDILVEYAGKPIKNVKEFDSVIAGLKEGQTVSIQGFRNNASLTLSITLGSIPEDSPFEKALRLWSTKNEEALAKIQTMADAGDAQALHFLGKAYFSGDLLPKDEKKGISLIQAAAEKGWVIAQHSLGYFYQWGKGVKIDQEQAIKWYRKAAEGGHPGAMMNLCFLLTKGKGATPEPKEVAKWHEKAANIGLGDAQFGLACLLAKGKDLPKDSVEALKWFILSKDNYEPDDETIRKYGENLRQVLEVSLSSKEKEEAQKRARNFIPRRVFAEFTEKAFKEQRILEE